MGTAIAFACFSCAAVVAKRREYLYLGGLLSSGLSILLWLQFAASIFGHSTSTFMFEVRLRPSIDQTCFNLLFDEHNSLGLWTYTKSYKLVRNDASGLT